MGPLCYFSERLVWVQDASRAVVSDLAGRYTAELVPRVHVIAVRDPTVHKNSGMFSLMFKCKFAENDWSRSVKFYNIMTPTVRCT